MDEPVRDEGLTRHHRRFCATHHKTVVQFAGRQSCCAVCPLQNEDTTFNVAHQTLTAELTVTDQNLHGDVTQRIADAPAFLRTHPGTDEGACPKPTSLVEPAEIAFLADAVTTESGFE